MDTCSLHQSKIENPRKGRKSDFQCYHIIILFNTKYLNVQFSTTKRITEIKRNSKGCPIQRKEINKLTEAIPEEVQILDLLGKRKVILK